MTKPQDGKSDIPQSSHRWDLFWTILACIFVGALLLTATTAILYTISYGTEKPISGNNLFEAIKPSLTILAGIAAIAYLIIKFRERSSAEDEEDRTLDAIDGQKLAQAVQELGSNSPQVRIAGVYSLIEIADNPTRGDHRQKVLDILCGYLRTPRQKTNPYGVVIGNDAAVESTILNQLAQHLNKDVYGTDKSWSDLNIDLHGATLTEPINLQNTRITKLNIDNLTTTGKLNLNNADLSNIDLTKQTLNKINYKQANFYRAHFNGAHFNGADFTEADFNEANFTWAHFNEANFTWADFTGTDFNWANFTKAHFNGAHFTWADFTEADFNWAHFNGANFTKAHFNGAHFTEAHFTWAHFNGAHFTEAHFTWADFTEAHFTEAHFNGANFTKAHFTEADFTKAHFNGADFTEADFTKAHFNGAHGKSFVSCLDQEFLDQFAD